MQELRSTDILDKEIQADARKKAERMLAKTDSECEKLIAQATKLIAAVKEHYLPSDVSLDAVSPAPSPRPIQTTPTAPIQAKTKKKRDIDWTFLWLVFIIGILIAGAILS